MTKKASPTPRGKRDLKGRTSADYLGEADTYIAAQAVSPLGPQLATEIAAVKTARAALAGEVTDEANLHAQLLLKGGSITGAEKTLSEACGDYVRKATRVATDAPSLTGLGAALVAEPTAPGPVGTVGLGIKEGPQPGEADLRMTRPPLTGSFVIQYKLEPSLPTDPWLPPMGIQTRLALYRLTGLPPSQHIRVRAQAIGDVPGPWSAEVLGQAR